MKRNIINVLIMMYVAISNMQAMHPELKRELNTPRPGDVIIKQQVEYKDPGRAGENVVWDFGQLREINDSYRQIYSRPRIKHSGVSVLGKDSFDMSIYNLNSLLTCREHLTNYFYRIQDDRIYLLGYENNVDKMHYLQPIPVLKFPFTYNDSLKGIANSEDLFSAQVPMQMHGTIETHADASGIIILPTGDTLKQVIRTHSILTQLSDKIQIMDSVHVNTTIENYKFWARGYRYPVFECIKTIHKRDTIEDVFETAFIFPPPQQYCVTADTANVVERERMKSEVISLPTNPWAGLHYNVSPNPTQGDVLFELLLPHSAREVRIQLRNQLGISMMNQKYGALDQGVSHLQFDIRHFEKGNYVLDFWLDGYLIHGGIIMKR